MFKNLAILQLLGGFAPYLYISKWIPIIVFGKSIKYLLCEIHTVLSTAEVSQGGFVLVMTSTGSALVSCGLTL